MAAMMLMVAVSIGVSTQIDAETEGTTESVGESAGSGETPTQDPIGSASNPRIIMGESTTSPYTIYTDQANGVNASIGFNESAFSSKRVVSFTVNGSTTTVGNTVNLTNVDVKITKDDTGKYTVNFKGKTAIDALTVTILLKVEDYVCSSSDNNHANHSSNCIPLPAQEYYFQAYVKVVANTGSISLSNAEGAVINSNLIFKFETDANITASVKNTSGDVVSGYKFYATGLPSGISMTVEGKIGGTINSAYNGNESETYTIYAVSESGTVIALKNATWTIGGVPENGTFDIKVKNPSSTTTATTVVDGNYIVVTEGDSFNVNMVATGFSIDENTQKISYNGETKTLDLTNGETITTSKGTGTFKVIVEADITTAANDTTNTPAKTVHVVKSFTVYVVGKIVDADLDPAVKSS